MKNGQVVGVVHTEDVTQDDVLGMIILGKNPPSAIPGPGAAAAEAETVGDRSALGAASAPPDAGHR